jgi:hypothetical protein
MSIVTAPRVILRADPALATRHVVRAGRVRSCGNGLSDDWRLQDARHRGRPTRRFGTTPRSGVRPGDAPRAMSGGSRYDGVSWQFYDK